MTSLELVRRLATNEASDECYTPINQIQPLLKYLDKSKTYYEATSGKSSLIVDAFNESGYSIVGSEGKDFFSTTHKTLLNEQNTNQYDYGVGAIQLKSIPDHLKWGP